MKFGYARVSSAGQSLATQIGQLKAENCDVIYSEKFTGTTVDRPKFNEMLNRVASGDTIVVTKLDRFARNTKEGKHSARETNPRYSEGRKTTYTDRDIQAALSMRDEGFTYAQISYQTGISTSTLKRRFKKSV